MAGCFPHGPPPHSRVHSKTRAELGKVFFMPRAGPAFGHEQDTFEQLLGAAISLKS